MTGMAGKATELLDEVHIETKEHNNGHGKLHSSTYIIFF
jgi:hypothetical protein